MAASKQLSRRGAVAMGATFIAFGVVPILLGCGVIKPSDGDAPGWVAIAAGVTFICGGLAVIVDFAIADGVGPDGDFKPGTPTIIRAANLVLGLAIIGLMAAITGWIAFGSGPREFTSTLTLPFLPVRWRSGALTGRIAFGASTLLLGVMFVACAVSGVRQLRRGIIGGRT